MAKTASNQHGICLKIMHVQRIPKVSIFMAVTTKIVPEKAQKWQDFGQNGAIMAGPWHGRHFFYQCLWLTKFSAKFGHSRGGRGSQFYHSFTVYVKEASPFDG